MKNIIKLFLISSILITGCGDKTIECKEECNCPSIEKESIEIEKNMYVSINEDKISVTSNYNDDIDIILTLSKHGRNNLFNISSLDKVSNIGDIPNRDLSSKTIFLSDIGITDWFGPYMVSAKNNADGDREEKEFTGGNHDYLNGHGGTKTARVDNILFKVNDIEVYGYEGYAEKIDIYWTNYVQAFNTKKVDGSGREVLKESFHITYNGNNIWEVEASIEFLEDVNVGRYYGLQAVNSNWNESVMFGYDNNWYPITNNIQSSKKDEDTITLKRGNDELKITLDNTYSLGKREYLKKDYGAFINVYPGGSKSYFYLIDNQDFKKVIL